MVDISIEKRNIHLFVHPCSCVCSLCSARGKKVVREMCGKLKHQPTNRRQRPPPTIFFLFMISSPEADAVIQSELSGIMLRGITGKTVPFAPKTPRMRGKLFLHDAPSERIVGGIPSCRIMGTHLAPLVRLGRDSRPS